MAEASITWPDRYRLAALVETTKGGFLAYLQVKRNGFYLQGATGLTAQAAIDACVKRMDEGTAKGVALFNNDFPNFNLDL